MHRAPAAIQRFGVGSGKKYTSFLMTNQISNKRVVI